jgi:membrane protein DedA with SNARE-associated domain
MIAWFIAFKYGEEVVLKFGKPIHITKEKIHKTKISFDKHQKVLIIFSKFVPGIRHIIPYLSGIYMIKVKNYALLNFVGSILWCITFIGLGLLLGEKWQIAVDLIKKYSLALLLLIVILFILL